jgi:hypothetical protein
MGREFLQHIPIFIQWACGALAAVSLVVAAVFLNTIQRICGRMRRAALSIRGSELLIAEARISGLSGSHLEELRTRCNALSGKPGEWWEQIESSLELYVSLEGQEGWFVCHPVREILPYEQVVGSQFNVGFYNAFPSLLTGVGLLLTFIAILMALYGVHYDESNSIRPVTGIAQLINGLSGKFLSSVVALSLAVMFTVVERLCFRKLRTSYDQMIAFCRAAVPYLSQSRILLDIQRLAAKQTVSVSNISSEVVDRFVSAFRNEVTPGLAKDMSMGVADVLQAEFRPTMQRMGETLEDLHAAILKLESQKQESVTGEISNLLESVETSIVQALGKMGSDFHEALAGAANREFGNVQGTLEATRQMLSDMNSQFGAMQASFAAIVRKAEETTSDQLRSGREQTEALTSLMTGLMTRLQETADQNLTSVRGQLTRVVSDLAERVGTLSQDMMSAVESVTKRSRSAAQDVLDKTGDWSESTTRRLEALLGNIEARSSEFQKAGQVLLQAHDQVSKTLDQSNVSLQNMAQASVQVKTYTLALSSQGDTLKGISEQQTQVSGQLRDTVGAMRGAFEQHGTLLKEYQRVLEDYRNVTDGLDEGLGKIFGEIHRGMRDYAQGVENNFREIVKLSNQAVPEISKLLQSQVQELSGQLEELTSVIAKSVERSNGRVK